jgi:hypothetical protein
MKSDRVTPITPYTPEEQDAVECMLLWQLLASPFGCAAWALRLIAGAIRMLADAVNAPAACVAGRVRQLNYQRALGRRRARLNPNTPRGCPACHGLGWVLQAPGATCLTCSGSGIAPPAVWATALRRIDANAASSH